MQKIIPIFRCKYCNEKKYSKKLSLEKHEYSCIFMYKHKNQLPSKQCMFQMLLDMNTKYRELEKKLEQIQTNQNNQSRRTILQHLKNIPPLSMTFSKWFNTMYVNREHMQIFFDKDITDSVIQVMKETISVGKLQEIPIRNYIQKPNQVYIYDSVGDCSNIFDWRLMEMEDWKRMFSYIIRKIKDMYFEWQRENKEYIDSDETLFELNYQYMKKINKISENIETKIRKIKENIIKEIQTSLVIIE